MPSEGSSTVTPQVLRSAECGVKHRRKIEFRLEFCSPQRSGCGVRSAEAPQRSIASQFWNFAEEKNVRIAEVRSEGCGAFAQKTDFCANAPH